ncbi:MAG: hypothetical protein KAH04_05015, partial [Psychrilyobacter sp.]|nr:hypothetical protein [Psychrilyobacter sp.]
MKKNKKLIIISFLVIFAIIPIPVPNQAKTKITNSIEQIIGREISLGSIKYNILRNIIYLDDFKIYEKDEETTFVSFDSFDMNIELLPLILGKLKLTDITLKNPNISLEYEKDIANYVDILSNISKYNNKNESVDITVEDKKPFIKSFEIKKINVEHITFKYKDKVVEGQNIFTVVVPQISYSDAKITLIAKAIFSETGSIKVNFEYSPESGNFNSEVRLDKLELDDKLYFIRSVDKIKELKGTLNSDIRITGNLKEKEFVGNGGLDISDFMVVSEEHGELVGVKKLEIKINNIEPLKNVYLFDNIYIDNGDYYLDNVSTYINSFSNKEEIEKTIKKDIKKAKSQKIIKNDFLKLNIPKITIKDVKLYSGKNDFFLSLEGKNIGNKKGDSTINLHTKINGNESTTLNLELKKQRDISNKNDLKFISGNIDLNKLSLSILNPFFEESGSQLGGYLNLNSKINTSNGNIITENYLEVIDLVIDEKKSNFKTEMIKSKNKLILLDNDFKLSGTIDVGKLTFNSVGLNTKLPLAHVDIIKITKEDIELGNTEFKGPEVSLEMTKDKKKSPSTVDEKTPSDYIFLF